MIGHRFGYGSTVFQNGMLGLERQTPSIGCEVLYTREPNGNPIAQRTPTSKQFLFGDWLGLTTALIDVASNSLTRVRLTD